MKDISDSDLQIILELSTNVGTNYLMWYGIHGKLTTKQIREEYDCCDELLKVLDDYDPEGDKSLDSKYMAVMVYEYLNKKYSKNHATLYRIGFSIAQQTLGLAARLSSSYEEDSGKSIDDLLPEHIQNLKHRLKEILPPDITKTVLKLVRNKIEEAGLKIDIGDLLVQVFNKVAFPEEGRKFTVSMGEEQKTYQTFTEMIGDLLNNSVQKFTKQCTSLDDLNNKEKFMESIGDIATDFLKKNTHILHVNKNYFIEELNQGRQAETERPSLAVEELVLGAIGGMAEGFWLKHQQRDDSTN
ncbi:MAG: hypothetical protein ACE5GV_06225 [Candidatus Scalindua sp.]